MQPQWNNSEVLEQASGRKCRVAKNGQPGKGRVGAVRERSQSFNPKTKTWTKRGPDGQFMDGKKNGTPFKGVRKED